VSFPVIFFPELHLLGGVIRRRDGLGAEPGQASDYNLRVINP
jgi:hypothetical protein